MHIAFPRMTLFNIVRSFTAIASKCTTLAVIYEYEMDIFMMLKQHILYALVLCCSSALYANIPIESRGLSQNGIGSSTNSIAASISAETENVPTNLNWKLM